MNIKLAIVGSREICDPTLVLKTIDILKKYSQFDTIELIVSGGARGVDSLAKDYAEKNNIPCKEHLPDWDKHGKAAGFIRNEKIINEATHVIAIWDGKSKGTKHSIKLSQSWNKFLLTYNLETNNYTINQPNKTLFS